MSKTVLVPITNGCEELEAVTIIDVLRRAGAEVTVASVGAIAVTASHGVKLVADMPIEACSGNEYDMIALPGGMPGAEHLRGNSTLTNMLKAQAAGGRFYAAICASPAVVLAHHALLDGKRCTCYPGMENSLAGAIATYENVVVDGNCITSRGPGTAMEFALTLAELLCGKERAQGVAKGLLA
ncbi:MAG: DJ-1 family glyoxalase III [Phycisphaerae bacterium]|jgi:4-methyl-5(b-hydroxyethyl)-thiazole monophosphate biosynthesis